MSRKKAIDAMCYQCIVDTAPGNGTWREQVENCATIDCPLYPYRPTTYTKKVDSSRAIERKSIDEEA